MTSSPVTGSILEEELVTLGTEGSLSHGSAGIATTSAETMGCDVLGFSTKSSVSVVPSRTTTPLFPAGQKCEAVTLTLYDPIGTAGMMYAPTELVTPDNSARSNSWTPAFGTGFATSSTMRPDTLPNWAWASTVTRVVTATDVTTEIHRRSRRVQYRRHFSTSSPSLGHLTTVYDASS